MSVEQPLLAGSVCLLNRFLDPNKISVNVDPVVASALHDHLTGEERSKLRADIREAVNSLLYAALEEAARISVEADMTLRGIKAGSQTEQGNCQQGKFAVSNTTLSM